MKMKACYRIRRMPCSMAICSSAEVVQFRKYLLCAVTCQGLCWLLGISQFSHWVMSNSFRPHGLQHTRLPCPSPSPEACSNSCPLSLWCHPTIVSSIVSFCCLQSFSASGSFPVRQFFISCGQITGASASASVLQWIFRVDWLVWFPCSPRDSQEYSPTPQFKHINSLVLSLLHSPTLTSIYDYWKNRSFD